MIITTIFIQFLFVFVATSIGIVLSFDLDLNLAQSILLNYALVIIASAATLVAMNYLSKPAMENMNAES